MSNLKLNENVFLGKQELNRLVEFLKDDGYLEYFKNNVENEGIVNKGNTALDPNFDYLRITQGSGVDKINIEAGIALYANGDIINVPFTADVADVPTDSVPRIVSISYNTTTIEVGKVAIATSGQITGTGTAFTEVLRGQPNFPSRIRFPNSANNLLEYNVISVTSDTQAQLAGTLVAETNEDYIVMGTFTPDASIPPANKEIFVYDSYTITVDTVFPPNSFSLARVTSNGATLQIEDTRYQFFETKASFDLQYFMKLPTQLIGIEQIMYCSQWGAGGGKSLVTMGWGFRSEAGDWVGNPQTKTIIITVGQGGTYTPWGMFTTVPPTGTMNGWRCYFANQSFNMRIYQEVVSQTTAGSTVTLSLRQYETATPIGGSTIVVVPPADNITFNFTYYQDATNPKVRSQHTFPIYNGVGVCEVNMPRTTPYVLNGSYQFGWNKWKSRKMPLFQGTYLRESSFDDFGVQTSTNTANTTGAGDFTLLNNPDFDFHQHAWLHKQNDFTATNSEGYVHVDTITELSGGVLTLPNTGNTFELRNLTSNPTMLQTIQNIDVFTPLSLSTVSAPVIRIFCETAPFFLERGAPTVGSMYLNWHDYQYGQNIGSYPLGGLGRQNAVWNLNGVRVVVPEDKIYIRAGQMVTLVQGLINTQPSWKVVAIDDTMALQKQYSCWNDARRAYGGGAPSEGFFMKCYSTNMATTLSATQGVFDVVNNWSWKVQGDTMLVTFDFEFTNIGMAETTVIGVQSVIPNEYLIQTNSTGFSMAGYGYCRMVSYYIGAPTSLPVIRDNTVYCQVRQTGTQGIEFLFRQIGTTQVPTGDNPSPANLPFATINNNPYHWFPNAPTASVGIQISGTVMIPVNMLQWT